MNRPEHKHPNYRFCNFVLRTLNLALLLTLMLLAQTATAQGTDLPRSNHAKAIQRGKQFLVDLFEPNLQLLPEFRGHNIYWLFHDNYLAAKVLSKSHPQVAKKISQAIKSYDVHRAGKIEILFGEANDPLPFRHHLLKDVSVQGKRTVRTEVVTERELRGWREYADLLLLSSIQIAKSKPEQAIHDFDAAMAMWDGKGLGDAVVKAHGRYATYKLALAVIAAKRLQRENKLPAAAMPTLRRLQNESGGWITDYRPNGDPIGKANVETSCLAIMALEAIDALPEKSGQPDSRQP